MLDFKQIEFHTLMPKILNHLLLQRYITELSPWATEPAGDSITAVLLQSSISHTTIYMYAYYNIVESHISAI